MFESTSKNYYIKLPVFEGPFDLLLFFIERDEIDIEDIPISQVTENFLDYIKHLERINVDLASEFIVVAATLMRIKAKMLLPRQVVNEEGEAIDPRQELVQRLLEYKRYKELLGDLRALEEKRSKRASRGNTSQEIKRIAEQALIEAEWENFDLYKLFKVFARVMNRFEQDKHRTNHKIVDYPYTIAEQGSFIRSTVVRKGRASFTDLFASMTNRIEAIVTFLALLELINEQKIGIQRGENVNSFWLVEKDGEEE